MSQTLSDASSRLCLGQRSTWVVLGVMSVACAAALGLSSRALAFTNPTDYGSYATTDPATFGGGAGRYFTGSPADGYSCEVCHSSPSNYSFPLTQKGLPLDGYVPRKTYRIDVTWPEAAAASAAAQAQGWNPATTFVGEFVAQDGGPAGTLSFSNEAELSHVAFPNLFCSTLAMAEQGEELDHYAMNIYAQETGSLPTELSMIPAIADRLGRDCTVDRGEDEEGNAYERRCIVAMRACGAQRVKFTWTAPDRWRGPIWFSAGFVTTYDRSAAPNDDDFVTTMSIPLNPGYEGSEHETLLDSGCSVAHGAGSARGTGGFLLGMLCVLGVSIACRPQRRWGRHHLASAVTGLLVLFTCIGCNEGTGLITNVGGAVGAYEAARCSRKCDPPIICRESAWPDAGTPEEAAEARKNKDDAPPAASPAAAGAAGAQSTGPKSLGSVTAQFVTTQPAEFISDWQKSCPPGTEACAPHYVTVWVEDEAEGQARYVRTLLGSQGRYVPLSLINYTRLGSDCQVPEEQVPIDAMASATIFVHQSHSVSWDGLLGSGHKAAPAGMYSLRIEVAIDEGHHFAVAKVPFMLGGPAPSTEMFPPEPAHTGVTLTYTPTP